jgi:diguanylate cyclase (GGDEF)-like protein
MSIIYFNEKEYLVERLQALVGSALLLFVASSFVQGELAIKILNTAFLVSGIGIMSLLIYVFALKMPNILLAFRKTILIITDMIVLTKVILIFEENGIFFLPFYVLLVMWNGLKLGLVYFYISILGAGASWVILLLSSSYWQSHNDILASFAITTLIIPLFYMRFITKVHEENYRLSSTLTQVTRDAFRDALTGLKNRKSYDEILSQRFKDKKPFALMFIDLNKFKSINDTYGHDAGDEVLIEVAKRLKSIMSEEEELFRLGGDEFVIISTRKKAFIPKFVQKLEESAIGPHLIGKISVRIELSLGIAFYPDDTTDAIKLTKYADEAMYKAKKESNTYHKFYNEM